MKYLNLIALLFILACNPIPKEDPHPQVPMLEELLKDKSKFRLITDMQDVSELIFLNDDRIFVKPDNSNVSFKIIDVNKTVVFQHIYDWNLPFYIDKQGNLYFNRKKFFHPDYSKQEAFKTVVFADSLSKKYEELKHLNDSLMINAVKQYEIELLKPYGLEPCPYKILNTERCDVFTIKDDVLLVRQTEIFKSEFSKAKKSISKFDDDVLIKWNNGRLPTPEYLSYYKLNGQKFKGKDLVPTTVSLKGKTYLYEASFGLYQILL